MSPRPRPLRTAASRIALAASISCLFFGGLELILQAVGFAYQPRQKLLWTPVISGFIGTLAFDIPTRLAPPGYLWLAAPDTIFTDRYGFRRPELPIRKDAGKYRIAFLGGSTTQGAHRPYPERAVRLLNSVIRTNRFEALNVACSSYSTHQSLFALTRWVLPREPDLVVIYHGWNDADVAGDGYSDHEKDRAANRIGKDHQFPFAKTVGASHIARLIGFLIDRADSTWPHIRVPPDRFERNLSEMARHTQAASVRTIIFTRPNARARILPKPSGVVAAAYRRAGFPDVPDARYDELHRLYTQIQRAVAARHPHTEIFEASSILDSIQSRWQAGEFGPDIQIFMRDAVHIYEFAEELLAIELACAIAPELEPQIRAHIQTADYHLARAREFLSDDQVFESAWHARACIRAAGGTHPEAETILRRAEAEFEFVRLFREARWGGPDEDFDSRIQKLRRCLQLRPSDFGVVLQIYRVCEYAARLGVAADAMAGFQPADRMAHLESLRLQLRSHLAVNRAEEVQKIARKILTLQPDDSLAIKALQNGSFQ